MSGFSGDGRKKTRGSWLMSCALKLALGMCVVPASFFLFIWSFEEAKTRPIEEMYTLLLLGFSVIIAFTGVFGLIVIPAVTRRMEFRPSLANFRQAGVYPWLAFVITASTGCISLYGLLAGGPILSGIGIWLLIWSIVALLEIYCFPEIVQRGNRTLTVFVMLLISSILPGSSPDELGPPPGYEP